MAKSGWKMIREPEFKQIKLLQEANLKVGQAQKVTGRSYVTIRKIYGSETLADYRELANPPKDPQEVVNQAVQDDNAKNGYTAANLEIITMINKLDEKLDAFMAQPEETNKPKFWR